MSVTVKSTSGNNIAVNQGAQAVGSLTIKKGDNLTVQGLSNVVSTDLQNGYTLVYDSTLNKWVTKTIEVSGSIVSLDGGTY